MARREPGFSSIFQMQCGQATAFHRIKRCATDGTSGIHHGGNVGNGGIHFLVVAGHAPLHASVEAAFTNASLPEDFSLGIRIKCEYDAGFLSRDQDFAALQVDQHG